MKDETMIAPVGEPTFAYLIVRKGDRPGAAYQLRPDITNIGRSGESHIRIDDELVSEQHARVRSEEKGKQFLLSDLDSTNGTKVNGQRLEGKHVLEDNDEIEMGGTVLVFKQV